MQDGNRDSITIPYRSTGEFMATRRLKSKTNPQFSHLDSTGAVRMVDVAGKEATQRTATARGEIEVGKAIAGALRKNGAVAKGNVWETARLAGILAAKRVDSLIPLCHTLPLDSVAIDFRLTGQRVEITAVARTTGRTGVEMEALAAVTVAALTIYDMCKALGKGMVIRKIELVEKTGGKSGPWRR